MRSLIKKALAGAGLASAAEIAHVRQQAAQSARKAEERLARVRAQADEWKQRYEEAANAAAEAKKAASEQKARADRRHRDADEWKAKAEALVEQQRETKARIEETRRVTNVARQHLMATETKLDLIEAAIQVLDARTRDGALPRP
jgi:hypothetical protein